MNRNRIFMAIKTIVVVLSVLMLGNIAPRLTNLTEAIEQTSSSLFDAI